MIVHIVYLMPCKECGSTKADCVVVMFNEESPFYLCYECATELWKELKDILMLE